MACLAPRASVLAVALAPEEVARLDALFPVGAARGERYGDVAAALLDH